MKLEPHFSKHHGLAIKLVETASELELAQRLRFNVFHDELGAYSDSKSAANRCDSDRFDQICDHLMVTKPISKISQPELCLDGQEIVGTYRLLRQNIAEQNDGFYSQSEFDVESLIAKKSELTFLELGRSCVAAPYRGTSVIELLWQGIWDYVRAHKIDVMFGCASFDGTEPSIYADQLSFLAHHIKTPPDWRVEPKREHAISMPQSCPESFDPRRAMLSLPPLIKGYLRLGSYVGDGAVIDYDFNTIDVLVMLPIANINPRYFAHFGSPTN